MSNHVISDSIVPMTFIYNYRVGEYLDRYLDGLKEKKIWGVKCPSCERVVVPPRMMCGKCNVKMKRWVRVKPTGVLRNFTIAYVDVEMGEVRDRETPCVIGQIKLEGADSLLTAKVEGVAPENVRTGLKVKAVWKAEPEGNLQDLDHFEPVK